MPILSVYALDGTRRCHHILITPEARREGVSMLLLRRYVAIDVYVIRVAAVLRVSVVRAFSFYY